MPLYLLRVSFCVRQLGGHMEHNLLIMETRVDRFYPRLPMSDIQASSKPGGEKKGDTEGQGKRRKESRNVKTREELRSTTVWETEEQRYEWTDSQNCWAVYPHPSLWSDKGILSVQSITLTIPPQISGHSRVFFFFTGTQLKLTLINSKVPMEYIWWI